MVEEGHFIVAPCAGAWIETEYSKLVVENSDPDKNKCNRSRWSGLIAGFQCCGCQNENYQFQSRRGKVQAV